MENTLATRIIDQGAAMDTQRAPMEPYWDELGSICLPRNGTIANQRQPSTGAYPDRTRVAENFDGTAMRSNLTLATGQASRITPQGGLWFMLRPSRKAAADHSAMNWWARVSAIIADELRSSNFYAAAFSKYLERGAFGLAAIECTEGENKRGLHFRNFPVGSFSIAENSRARVDTVFRTATRTPAQILDMFRGDPDATIPDSVAKAAEDDTLKHRQTEKVIHAVFPRTDRDPRSSHPREKPIASVHVHVESKTVLLESGFDSMPVAASRWMPNPLSPYGWGPGDYALPEALQANFQSQMLDLYADLAANPRILYPAGMKDEIDLGPGGLTSFDPSAGENAWPREWLTGGRYDIAKDRMADKTRAIESAFFVELFNAVMRLPSTATATQVAAIVNESRELFHPIFANMTGEFHIPILRRAFAILFTQGAFPDPPASVWSADDIGPFIADPEVEFTSPMALAIEATHTQTIAEVYSIFTPLANFDPAYLDVFDPEAVVRHVTRAKGLPPELLRDPKALKALRAQREESAKLIAAQQASQSVRNMGGVDETAKAAAMLSQP